MLKKLLRNLLAPEKFFKEFRSNLDKATRKAEEIIENFLDNLAILVKDAYIKRLSITENSANYSYSLGNELQKRYIDVTEKLVEATAKLNDPATNKKDKTMLKLLINELEKKRASIALIYVSAMSISAFSGNIDHESNKYVLNEIAPHSERTLQEIFDEWYHNITIRQRSY